jgi:hypothetical protein
MRKKSVKFANIVCMQQLYINLYLVSCVTNTKGEFAYTRRRMNSSSFLQQAYKSQKKSELKRPMEHKHLWLEGHRLCLIWVLIGILTGGVGLATMVTLYVKQLCKYPVFRMLRDCISKSSCYIIVDVCQEELV